MAFLISFSALYPYSLLPRSSPSPPVFPFHSTCPDLYFSTSLSTPSLSSAWLHFTFLVSTSTQGNMLISKESELRSMEINMEEFSKS